MRGTVALTGGVMLAFVLLIGCAKPLYVRTEERSSYFDAQAGKTGYVKRAAIAATSGAPTPSGPQAEALLLQTLIEAIRNSNSGIALAAPQDPDYPAFMKIYSPITGRNAFGAAQTARRQGYHYLIQAAVENVLVNEEKRGIWWFRKTRHYLTVVAALDVYDTFTGAKIISEFREQTERIDPDSYASFSAGTGKDMPAIDALVARVAGSMGKQASRAIKNGKWVCSVTEVRDLQIALTPGLSSGVRVGDRFDIYEGRRIVDGSEGEKFIAPGYKVAEVLITEVEENGARASFKAPSDILPGDIAVPSK
jgi:hypothetical protein